MSSFSCRRFLSVALLVLLLAPQVEAKKQANNTTVSSLQSVHKVAPAQGSKIEQQERQVDQATLDAVAEVKRKLAGQHRAAVEPSRGLQSKLTCRSACIMDANTGRVLYDLSADRPGQPASTIKVLTGLIAIESLKGNEMVSTSAYAANMPASKIYLKKGASYRANDLINAVLLASANDASVALAEKLAGSEQEFARLMTRKAESLGARNTICKSANGLTRPGQQTTARDLATVFSRAMHNQEFAERMSTTKVRTSDGKVLLSHNKALWTVDGAVAGKTGYTAAAGKTYVGKFERNGRAIIVSLLGSASMWTDVATLVKHGFASQEMASLSEDGVTDGLQVVQAGADSMAPEQAAYFAQLNEQMR